jgi:hypothetical protein
LGNAALQHAEIIGQFAIERLARVGYNKTPVHPLHRLLTGKRNKNANNNNSNLACEVAPSVQRLWQMKMHAAAPLARRA